jgi:hypothetical protein
MSHPLILAMYSVYRDYTFTIAGYHFGFMDAEHSFQGDVTFMQLGPLGEFYHVPVSAAQGWIITVLLLLAMLATAVWLLLRSRRASPPTNIW